MIAKKSIEQFKYWMFVTVSDCGRWANKTFPLSDTKSIISHLKEEISEFIEADKKDSDISEISEEMADVILLMFHYAHKRDIDLGKAIMDKFDKNTKRKWKITPEKGGHFKHI